MMRQVDAAGRKPGLLEQAISVHGSLPYINRVFFHRVSLVQPLTASGVVFMGPVRRACVFLHGSILRVGERFAIGGNPEKEAANGF